jgi:hypothetical protein
MLPSGGSAVLCLIAIQRYRSKELLPDFAKQFVWRHLSRRNVPFAKIAQTQNPYRPAQILLMGRRQ